MSTTKKIIIYAGVLGYAMLTNLYMYLIASLVYWSFNPSSWDKVVQFIVLGLAGFLLHRAYLVTSAELKKREAMMESKEDLLEVLEQIKKKHGRS